MNAMVSYLIIFGIDLVSLFSDLNVLLFICLKVSVIKSKFQDTFILFKYLLYFERAPILADEQCRSKRKCPSGTEV